jgi:A118 family predicted phage portal protein
LDKLAKPTYEIQRGNIMNTWVTKYLETKGYYNISSTYYNYIKIWEQWFKNDVDFHKYYDNYGTERKMYSLGMAKRICEDWASTIYSDRDKITTDKKNNKKYTESLIKDFKLHKEIPKCIEKTSWSGTCGAIIRVKNAKVVNGKLTAEENTTRELIKVTAKQIIPLKVEHGNIVDVAFVSDTVVDKVKAIYIELHQLLATGYKISNIYLNAQDGTEIANESVLSSFETGSNIPLFSLLFTPKDNPIEDNNGLGFSVYGDAIDQLKGCDITYHNFMQDFVLGGKKIIYNKKLVKYRTVKTKVNGVDTTKEIPVYPDDISKQQFLAVGDEYDTADDKKLIHEYNPALRVEDNKNGVQFSLDLMAFKVGLGTKYYQFNNGTVVTATQYVGDRQDLVINAKKYRDNLSEFISGIIKAGLLIGRLIFKEKVTEDCNVLVDNVDGFMQDEEAIKQSAREDLALGIISKVEYRMTVYHETEEVAKEMLAKLDEENTIKNVEVNNENTGNNNN